MDINDNNSNNAAFAEECHHYSISSQQLPPQQLQLQQQQQQLQPQIQPISLCRTDSNINSNGITSVVVVAGINYVNSTNTNTNLAMNNGYIDSHSPSPLLSPGGGGGVVQVQQHPLRTSTHQLSEPTLSMTMMTINGNNNTVNNDFNSTEHDINMVHNNAGVVETETTDVEQQEISGQHQQSIAATSNLTQHYDVPTTLNVENVSQSNSNEFVDSQQGIIADSVTNNHNNNDNVITPSEFASRYSYRTSGRHNLSTDTNESGTYFRKNPNEQYVNHDDGNNNDNNNNTSLENVTSPPIPVSCGWTDVILSSTQRTSTMTGRRNLLSNNSSNNNRFVGPTNGDGFVHHQNNHPSNLYQSNNNNNPNYNSDRLPNSNNIIFRSSYPHNTNMDGNNNSTVAVIPNQHNSNHNINNISNMNTINYTNVNSNNNGSNNDSTLPSPRSLHSTALLNGIMYIFGGYIGTERVNSFHAYSFSEKRWSPVLPAANSEPPPSPRDRHVSVSYGNAIYIHGGFDGVSRDGSLFCFDFSTMTWRKIVPLSPPPPPPPPIQHDHHHHQQQQQAPYHRPPSARHSHAAVVYEDSMYLGFGFDGSYKSDLHEYKFATNRWCPVPAVGQRPRPRYRTSCVVYMNTMILYGGHDGTRHLSDTMVFDFLSLTWNTLITDGIQPVPRDSHVAVIHMNSMYVFGGSSGTAMNDLHELQLPSSGIVVSSSSSSSSSTTTLNNTNEGNGAHEYNNNNNNLHRNHADISLLSNTNNNNNTTASSSSSSVVVARWRPVPYNGQQPPPRPRFCHVAVTYNDSMYCFGGYDGINRLNSFIKFDFSIYDTSFDIPSSTLVHDLRLLVNNQELSDIIFIVENKPIYAHKVMLLRCSYFQALFSGYMKESKMDTIRIEQVRYPIFIGILEYLYTDQLVAPVAYPLAMEYFVAADLFGISRLKIICEKYMIQTITIDNAASIFYAADIYSASVLRQRAKRYILNHFEETSKTSAFEDMGRQNVDLVFELLRSR